LLYDIMASVAAASRGQREAFYVERGDGMGSKSASSLHGNILNRIGKEAHYARQQLRLFASKSPEEFIEKRTEIEKRLADAMIVLNYEMIWDLMNDGKIGNEELQVLGKRWSPRIPEETCDRIADSLAQKISDIMDEVMDTCWPIGDALANSRIVDNAKVDRATKTLGAGAAPAAAV
jgi:hypothetical protein